MAAHQQKIIYYCVIFKNKLQEPFLKIFMLNTFSSNLTIIFTFRTLNFLNILYVCILNFYLVRNKYFLNYCVLAIFSLKLVSRRIKKSLRDYMYKIF